MFFKKQTKETLVIRENIITVWSPSGQNTVKTSWPLANQLAAYTSVALVELPCHGIPRLAMESNFLDRTLHTEASILEYERKSESPLSFCQKVKEGFVVLPANAYGLPDHPVSHKISQIETLQDYPGFFLNQARKNGYNAVIFDCQGTLVSPMTFFALQLACRIILVLNDSTDLAWTLINKERLSEAYEFPPDRFVATSQVTHPKYFDEISRVLKCPVLTIKQIIKSLAETQLFLEKEVAQG